MNNTITEKNYPIEIKWIYASVLGSSIILLFIIPFFLGGVAHGTFSLYLLALLIFLPFNVIITILKRANFHYSIEEKFMILHQGILSKQQRNIPYGVIQNIFVHQRLVDRIFGLASLSIENASQGGGNQNSNNTKAFGITISNQQTKKRGELEMPGFNGNKISIPGLTKQNAEALRELILQKMKDNPVEDNQSGL